MLRAGDGRFLVGQMGFDDHPALLRRMWGRASRHELEWSRLPQAATFHWDLADVLLHHRPQRFRRGIGDKRYSKWHTVHMRVRTQPMHAPWPNLEGPARRAGMRALPLSMRRWGVALKILAIRRKK